MLLGKNLSDDFGRANLYALPRNNTIFDVHSKIVGVYTDGLQKIEAWAKIDLQWPEEFFSLIQKKIITQIAAHFTACKFGSSWGCVLSE